MLKSLKVLLFANALLLAVLLLSHTSIAQRPPATNAEGIPFFNVNINPTDVPPMVNINPHGLTPRVDINQFPPIAIAQVPPVTIIPTGCADRHNFETGVGRSISGPLVVTYLNWPAQTQATLSSGNGRQRLTPEATPQLASAMYLAAGQQLEFDKDVIYSGCKP